MKHLIETANPSGLAITEYDRLILNSTTNDVIVKGGGYVNLGLPSGLKWAKCNIGAEKETEWGDYFMWGSVTPNTTDNCRWETYPFNGGSSSYDEEYFNTHKSEWLDDNGNLKPEFDAATQIMGDGWRMPTEADFQELLDNTDNEWVTNYNGTGIKGRKFTSKKNGNSIFIPAAGQHVNNSHYHTNEGYVWSSSLDTSHSNSAWNLYFDSSRIYASDTFTDRYQALSVRGVRK